MAATTKVKDVIWRISVILQDVAPQFQRWPEKELVHWLNDAQVAITKFMPSACARRDVVKLKPGTRQSIESIAAADCKPGDGSTPGAAIVGTLLLDVTRNMGSDGLTPGNSIRPVPREIMDTQTPNWHTVAGTSISSYMFDPRNPRYFYVTPGVHATTPVWAEIDYTAQPIAIPNTGSAGSELYLETGGSTTVISIADEFVDDLVNYVVARSYNKASEYGDPNKATAYTNLFTNSLNAKVAAITGSNPNLKQLPLAPQPLAQAS
jgi:hypothetical protein